MSVLVKNEKGLRLNLVAVAAHKSGDLVYESGFYGVVQDDVVAGALFALIMVGEHYLKRPTATTLNPGTRVYAMIQGSHATSIPVAASSSASNPTTGVAIGRVTATGNASLVPVLLFHVNSTY